MGVLPKRALEKFKIFHLLSLTNELFYISKYKIKIKFEKIWGNKMEGRQIYLINHSRKNNSVTTYARLMKFSGWA